MKKIEIQKEEVEKVIKVKKTIEISSEAKEDRRLLAAFLLEQTEGLLKERIDRKQKIEAEKIELRGGKVISRLEIKQFVTTLIQNYPAIFPNDNPFFKNMFRLHPRLIGLDYNKYRKPRLAGKLLKHLTYDRFETEVLPTLRVLAMPDGVLLNKCYRYLTSLGIEFFIQYRDQANELMGTFADGQWYEFNVAFSEKYKKQARLFE